MLGKESLALVQLIHSGLLAARHPISPRGMKGSAAPQREDTEHCSLVLQLSLDQQHP